MSAPLHSPNPELTPEVLAELRAQLEQARAGLSARIAAGLRTEGVGDTPAQDPETEIRGDQGDESVTLEAWDTSQQLLFDLQAQLAEVEHALAKFPAGTYGIGERSGRPIPLARLRVFPEARDTVEAESQRHD